jgi:methylaspartate mutase epsilon subunit
MKTTNQRLSDEEFQRMRQEVLAQWPTGKEVDLDEAIEFQKRLPLTKNYALKISDAKKNKVTLIRSDAGVATLEENIELLRYLQNEGGTDILGTHIDSLTRVQRFKEAEQGLQESKRTGKSLLNGFPIVCYGVTETRKIIESVELPLQPRAPAIDTRLIYEIALAGGYTCINAGPMLAFWHYNKNTPLDKIIKNFQYKYRLAGYYQEKGVPIQIEIAGMFPTLTPDCLATASGIISALIAAEQGVKYTLIDHFEQGNLTQDIANARIIPKLTREYLVKFGYDDLEVTCATNSWSKSYPADYAQSFAVTLLGPVVAVLSEAEVCHIKTIDEAETIPTKENNAFSLRGGKMMINLLKDIKFDVDTEAVRLEEKMSELETKALVDRVIDLGEGDVAIGVVRAVESGELDQVFATNEFSALKAMGIRDAQGAVRFFDHGNLPFSKEIAEFHQQKLAEREKKLGKKADYETVVNDLLSISRGSLLPG